MAAETTQRIEEASVHIGGRVTTAHGMDVVTLTPDKLFAAVRRLQTELGFDLLLDITAVDWPEREPRFDVVYHFYSTAHHVRVRVKTAVPAADPAVDSLVSLYGS